MERLHGMIEEERATMTFDHDPEAWKKARLLPPFHEYLVDPEKYLNRLES